MFCINSGSSPSYFWSSQLSQLFSKLFNPLLKLGSRNYWSKSLSIFKKNDTMVKKQGQHKQSQNCYTKVLSQQNQQVSICCQIINISLFDCKYRIFQIVTSRKSLNHKAIHPWKSKFNLLFWPVSDHLVFFIDFSTKPIPGCPFTLSLNT